jgi:hypothetical protein
MVTKAAQPPKVTSQEQTTWTQDEVEIVKELCQKFNWDTDISLESGEANIGDFYVEKWIFTEERMSLSGPREVQIPEYILYEEVVEYNYPHEPDFSDSVEFDTVRNNVYAVMARLWMRDKEYEIDNIIEGYSMHREFSKEYM